MRLVPYGPMFIKEVIELVQSSPKLTADVFGIEDPLPYCTCTAYASPQPYRVLLDNDEVVGWCRLDYGVDLPGRKGLPSIHEFVAKPGYHMALLLRAEEELRSNGYEQYVLWVRLAEERTMEWANKRRGYSPVFSVGLVRLKEMEAENAGG